MKLGTRIFLCYLFVFVVCFSYPISWIQQNLRTRYLEGVEDPLVDQANVLAELVGREMEKGPFDAEAFYEVFQGVYSRVVAAQIYDFAKSHVDLRVYITDRAGTVVFDSASRQTWGEDYSGWRDVRLTLAGEYGARTTLADPRESTSSVLYVAAPLLVRGQPAGVLTVAKPTTNINNFLKNATPDILRTGLLAVGAAILLSYLVSMWITAPIKRLTVYADDIRWGRRAVLPRLDSTEIGTMGAAFEKMRVTLEGKQYVERYVQNLAHEIKSPLSAIRGAAELMEEDMPSEQRARFLGNIRHETNRVQELIDRMLELSALENKKILREKGPVSVSKTVQAVLESKKILVSQKKLAVTVTVAEDLTVPGDGFLLRQALGNLLQNAIDFCMFAGTIEIRAMADRDKLHVTVDDDGSSIPEYALGKVFEKFFSLQRPDSGKKSTGLGLNFVREVAALHGGEVGLENLPGGGVRATLTLPL